MFSRFLIVASAFLQSLGVVDSSGVSDRADPKMQEHPAWRISPSIRETCCIPLRLHGDFWRVCAIVRCTTLPHHLRRTRPARPYRRFRASLQSHTEGDGAEFSNNDSLMTVSFTGLLGTQTDGNTQPSTERTHPHVGDFV